MLLSTVNVCLLLLIPILASMPRAAAAQEALTMSETFAAAKSGTAEQFAAALAKAKMPVGVVLLEKDVKSKPNSVNTAGEATIITADSTVSVFEARYSEYRVERTAQSIVIAPRKGGWCTAPLRSQRKSLTASGEAFEVLYRIVRTWTDDQTPYIPPGIVGSLGERPDTYRVRVAINVVNGSLEDALNEVVVQAPGLGWAVREVSHSSGNAKGAGNKDARGCNLALFDGAGWLETSWTLAVTSPIGWSSAWTPCSATSTRSSSLVSSSDGLWASQSAFDEIGPRRRRTAVRTVIRCAARRPDRPPSPGAPARSTPGRR
jgi:hypothetical protein